MDSGFSYLLIVLCLVMLSVSMLRRTQQRRATARDLTREQLARLRDQSNIHQSMEELLLQIEDVSRRINAQVDTKFAKLETVVRDADDRIARLQGLLGRQRPPAPSAGDKRPTSKPAEKPEAAKPKRAQAFRPGLPTGTTPAPAPPPTGQPTPAGAGSPAEQTPPNPSPGSTAERRTKVYEMADAGAKPMAIADALQIPLGEVELLLNLRGFK